VREAARIDKTTALDEVQSKALLAACGLPIPTEKVVATEDEAVHAARAMGYPVVIKVVSADIAHKSDVGGVMLNLRDEDSLRKAYRDIEGNVRRHAAAAKIEGTLIAPYIEGGLELVLGLTRDPDMGCVVMFGSGGVLLELVQDVTFGPPGIDAQAAEEMIERTRAGKLLAGYRGSRRFDRAAVIDALVCLGRMARDLGDVIEAVDINPLVVLDEGRGAHVLDGLVFLRRQ
jgi:succinyl-CoA synthetase beta subunit